MVCSCQGRPDADGVQAEESCCDDGGLVEEDCGGKADAKSGGRRLGGQLALRRTRRVLGNRIRRSSSRRLPADPTNRTGARSTALE